MPFRLDWMRRHDTTRRPCNSSMVITLRSTQTGSSRPATRPELYGFERLQKLFAANPTANEAADEAVRFGQDDDVTVVTLTYVGEKDPAPESAGDRLDFAHP